MIHLFLNALGASAGAGLTYLYNVVPILASRPDVRTTLALQPQLQPEFRKFPVNVLDLQVPGGSARRFWFEQRALPEVIRKSGAEALISAGNFAIRNSPVSQILLSGNSLYTSPDFYRDLAARREYGMWLDTRIKAVFARKSVRWADITVAPSRAFADELQRWTGKETRAIHHGFDGDVFFANQSPLPDGIQRELQGASDCLRLLFVSHYNYYRNFETLFRAIPLLKQKMDGRRVRLFLTCKLNDEENPGTYKTAGALALLRKLGIEDDVVQLGAVPYRLLYQVYRSCDIYVTPAYAETFAHPLVEAMASGLPVVASDLPVHREVCGEAAIYFDRFSPEHLAASLYELATNSVMRSALAAHGAARSQDFSWNTHVDRLLELAKGAA
jgi:glycosyltransferase involved in cell wall biosynthesis